MENQESLLPNFRGTECVFVEVPSEDWHLVVPEDGLELPVKSKPLTKVYYKGPEGILDWLGERCAWETFFQKAQYIFDGKIEEYIAEWFLVKNDEGYTLWVYIPMSGRYITYEYWSGLLREWAVEDETKSTDGFDLLAGEEDNKLGYIIHPKLWEIVTTEIEEKVNAYPDWDSEGELPIVKKNLLRARIYKRPLIWFITQIVGEIQGNFSMGTEYAQHVLEAAFPDEFN